MARMIGYSFLLVSSAELALLARGIVSKRLAKVAGELDAGLVVKCRKNAKRRLARGVATAPPDARHP